MVITNSPDPSKNRSCLLPLSVSLCSTAPPLGEPRGIVRIRPMLHKNVSAYRETPQSGPLGLPAPLSGEPRKPPLKGEAAHSAGGVSGGTRNPIWNAPRRIRTDPCCPLWGKCRTAAKVVPLVFLSCYHSTNHTPSVRPFGLPAPPLGSQEGPFQGRF